MSEPNRWRGSICNCQCHSSEAYKHITACCCSHQYMFNQCPICDTPNPLTSGTGIGGKQILRARFAMAEMDARGIRYALDKFSEQYSMPDDARVSFEPIELNPGATGADFNLALGYTLTAEWRI